MATIKATLIDSMGSDLSVVNAARVSFGKESEWENAEEVWVYPLIDESRHEMRSPWVTPVLKPSDAKLIKYLATHKHFSPFGHCFASFHVKAPIFVARQLVKHKFLRWNEISRRYVDDEPEFYEPDVWRGKAEDKKQGSSGVIELGDWDLEVADNPYFGTLEDTMAGIYRNLIRKGVAPEQARMVLPQSTMTEWYWSGSLDAFADMCKLRCAKDTQEETRVVADQVSEAMAKLYPVSWENLLGDST